ncbi:hypothetical protein RUND412_005246 [Rhizina undulata]
MPPRIPRSLLRLTPLHRSLATASTTSVPPPNPEYQVFNRTTKRLQRDRAGTNPEASRAVDYLKEEVAERLAERLLFINRPLPIVLDLGASACHIAKAIAKPRDETTPLTEKIPHLISADHSRTQLFRDVDLSFNAALQKHERILIDEEAPLPFPKDHFSAVLSSLSLHWINDLPRVLSGINHVLLPDAPFISAMFGGDTLYELRTSLQLAEMERLGGVSPRVSPLADVKDMGGLLQRAGFKMLTIDVDDIIVDYPDIFALMMDLGAMGESNAVLSRMKGPIARDVLTAAQAIYRELHGNEDGTLPATFRVIYMIGWKEAPNQPKPLKRGSGEINLKDVLEKK